MEWISVKDRLPEPEVMVLATVNGYDGLLTLERRWETCYSMTESDFNDFLYWDWVDNEGQDLEGLVSHWTYAEPLFPAFPLEYTYTNYEIIIREGNFEDGDRFEARVRELPDLLVYAETHEDAYNEMQGLIEVTAQSFSEDGKDMPEPINGEK